MKNIRAIYTTSGELLQPGTLVRVRGHHPLRDRSEHSESMGAVKTLQISEFMSTVCLELESGERHHLIPQYRWVRPVRLEVRLTDLEYSVEILKLAQHQKELAA